jgi:hypothetical protein
LYVCLIGLNVFMYVCYVYVCYYYHTDVLIVCGCVIIHVFELPYVLAVCSVPVQYM